MPFGIYAGAPGLLKATLDPNGNLLCYKYDSLSRVTGVNGSGTNCRLFFYDNSTGFSGSIPSGVTTPINSLGRMVEAATTNCSTTLLTDIWFSYDKDGHVTDQWELTPNSGQYYHSTATFYGNGTINTLQLASPSLYTMTYGLDGEGRWETQSASMQNYVTAKTAYNAASQPTEIALTGSQPDQDDYVYDPNTGRMTNFTFQVGTTPVTMVGQLNWNANGSLNNLAITDGFNSGGTQTCYFNPSTGSGMGYDDLGRLVNDDCGSGGWGQTFSYGQFNNLTKAVISGRTGVAFNPGYNSANNQYASGFGATYDSNGNLTNDTFHTYTWNEFSKLKSADMNGTGCATSGECIVYDALGRQVEIDKGSTHTEIWYTQLGKNVFMNGATPSNAYWPTPGGGTEILQGNCPSSCNNYYMHKDWLRSARIVSATNGHTVISDRAFAPYGEIYAQFGSNGIAYEMFTGDTQDIVAGTMETPNREYNNAAQGRWISPDPTGAGWNLYAYGANPNSGLDPSGLLFNGGSFGGWGFGQLIDGFEYPNIFFVAPTFGTVGADAGDSTDNSSSSTASSSDGTGSSISGGGITASGIATFAAAVGQAGAAAWAAAIFQEAEPDEDEPDPEVQWGQPLVPLKPGEFVYPETGWEFNLLNPGPLSNKVAETFAGGQYSPMVVGGEGWEFDAVYRVYGTNADGHWYTPIPQTGGLQSQIDLNLRPEWGNTADNVACVSLPAGSLVYVGPAAAQTGQPISGYISPSTGIAYGSGGPQSLGISGTLQIYVPGNN